MLQPTVHDEAEPVRRLLPDVIELKWLGDPKHRPLLNCENLTVTQGGRRSRRRKSASLEWISKDDTERKSIERGYTNRSKHHTAIGDP